MNWKGFISILAFTGIVLVSILSGPGCANIIPPEGGLRDSLPPVLLRSNPEDSTRNFEGNRINLTFDEYVTIDNFQQNVLISPLPRVAPTATYKLNTVSVRLRDTLEPNTTYSINFGDAIKDVNEGNIKKNYTYIFTTGSSFDSLSFGGNILLAQTGKPDSTLIVMLHRNGNDSAVVNERPRYVAKVDGKGNFVFRNLPTGTFYLYALQDESRSYRYMDKKKLFAFADSAIVISSGTPRKTLYAYVAAPATEAGGGGSSSGRPTSQRSPGTSDRKNVTDRRLKYSTTVSPDRSHDLLKQFAFTFDVPLKDFDSTKIRLHTDTLYTPVTGYNWSLDTSRKQLTLNYKWNEGALYHLVMQKEFATDTLGQQLPRADTITFTILKSSDYGKLAIRFRNLDLAKKPVLQFVQGAEVVSSFPLTSPNFSQALFPPGDYDLRILHDTNGNGKWDPGDFFGKRQQPEIVTPVTRAIKVRQSWDNEFEIAL